MNKISYHSTERLWRVPTGAIWRIQLYLQIWCHVSRFWLTSHIFPHNDFVRLCLCLTHVIVSMLHCYGDCHPQGVETEHQEKVHIEILCCWPLLKNAVTPKMLISNYNLILGDILLQYSSGYWWRTNILCPPCNMDHEYITGLFLSDPWTWNKWNIKILLW